MVIQNESLQDIRLQTFSGYKRNQSAHEPVSVWSLCARSSARTKAKMSEFRVRKILLITKAPTEKIGALVVLQIHLKKVKSLGFYYARQRENERDCFCENSNSSRVSVKIKMSKAGDIWVKPWQQRRLEKDGVRENKHLKLLHPNKWVHLFLWLLQLGVLKAIESQ